MVQMFYTYLVRCFVVKLRKCIVSQVIQNDFCFIFSFSYGRCIFSLGRLQILRSFFGIPYGSCSYNDTLECFGRIYYFPGMADIENSGIDLPTYKA